MRQNGDAVSPDASCWDHTFMSISPSMHLCSRGRKPNKPTDWDHPRLGYRIKGRSTNVCWSPWPATRTLYGSWLSLIMRRWPWLERLPAHLDGAHSLACALVSFLCKLLGNSSDRHVYQGSTATEGASTFVGRLAQSSHERLA